MKTQDVHTLLTNFIQCSLAKKTEKMGCMVGLSVLSPAFFP